MVGLGGQLMLDRSSTIHRSMRWGASKNNGFAQTFFGLRHTEQEMESFGGHSANIFGVKWREKFWNGAGKPLGNAMGLDGRTSLMGTPWAPSSWASAMDLVRNPTAYNHTMMNVSQGLPYTQSVRTLAAEGKSPTMGTWRQYKNVDPRTKKLTTSEAHLAINNFLGVGSKAKGANVARDYALGKLFTANDGFAASEKFIGKSAFKTAYGSGALKAGAAMAEHGGAAIGGVSTLGAATYGAYLAAGTLLRAYTWYGTAKFAAETAYKGLEAYYYKAPMAAYSAVGRQLTRGAFSSGDAALLTGIPANNRMRAVQAIQGSRMNARSALGGEASLLAGHFG
jgi:hypothetical protein